jgi:membrane-associated phospholipid phosphatase
MLWPKAYKEVTYYLMNSKMHYKRARPNQLDTTLTTVFEVPHHASYPSGHAAHSRLLANVLGWIDGKNALEYKKMAMDIGRRREIAGVHYPSDTAAGIALADAVFLELMKVPSFKIEMDKAKEEFRTKNSGGTQH